VRAECVALPHWCRPNADAYRSTVDRPNSHRSSCENAAWFRRACAARISRQTVAGCTPETPAAGSGAGDR